MDYDEYIFGEFEKYYDVNFGFMYMSYDEIKKQILKYDFIEDLENYVNINKLKENLIKYLNYLFTREFKEHYYKQLNLYKNFKTSISYNCDYLLSLYCNHLNPLECYRNFSYLLYKLVNKLEIYPYKYISYDDFDKIIKQSYIIKPLKEEAKCEIEYPWKKNLKKYVLFENNGNLDEKTINYIKTEKMAYEWSKSKFRNNIWVSKEIGDGLGYDIYSSSDLFYTKAENLIESKYSSKNNFNLTNNEFNVMLGTNNYDDAFYYVYCCNSFYKTPLILKYSKNHEDIVLENYENNKLLYSINEEINNDEKKIYKIKEYQRKLF